MNKNYDTIRRGVIEAVPEILELEFGCEIHTEGNENSGIYVGKTEKGAIVIRYGETIAVAPWPGYMNILGRPIRLADVLLAMYRRWRGTRTLDDYGYTEFKEFEVKEITELLKRWDCRKDDLREQSEETISWLAQILG